MVQLAGRARLPGADDRTPEQVKADLEAYAVFRSEALRTGGVVVGDLPVATNDAGMAFLKVSYDKAMADPDYTIPAWQVSNVPIAFVAVDNATLRAFDKVNDWVQAIFSKLKAVAEGIAGGSITTTDAIDVAFAEISQVIPLS